MSAENEVVTPKPRPNHRMYLAALRAMTPEQRLMKAFELSQLARELLRHGLRERFPASSESEIHQLYLQRLAACHNRNY